MRTKKPRPRKDDPVVPEVRWTEDHLLTEAERQCILTTAALLCEQIREIERKIDKDRWLLIELLREWAKDGGVSPPGEGI